MVVVRASRTLIASSLKQNTCLTLKWHPVGGRSQLIREVGYLVDTCSLCRATLKITQGRDLETFAIGTELTEDDLDEDNAIRYGWNEFRIHRYVSGPNPRGKRTVKIYVCDNCHYEIHKAIAHWWEKEAQKQHASASSSKDKFEPPAFD